MHSASASPEAAGHRVGTDSGLGPGIKPHLSCLCDLELVISLHSEKTEIKHLPQPLTGTS